MIVFISNYFNTTRRLVDVLRIVSVTTSSSGELMKQFFFVYTNTFNSNVTISLDATPGN